MEDREFAAFRKQVDQTISNKSNGLAEKQNNELEALAKRHYKQG
jgi:hypothetical protein